MKTSITQTCSLVVAFALTGATTGFAQGTAYPEIEPNGPKTQATAVQCLHSGDYLSGITMGNSTAPGELGLASADTFRLETCPLPLAIYRHRLFIDSATPGQVGTLVGRNQVGRPGTGGTIGLLDVAVQTSWTDLTPQPFNQWYGFGKAEEVYYRIEGTRDTSAPYTVVLTTAAITPTDVVSPMIEGLVTITAVGQAHATNTDMWVYTSSLDPIASFGNDDTWTPNPSSQSTLTRHFTPGIYYLAISSSNLANDQASPADDGNATGNVFDFANIVATSDHVAPLDVGFAISDFNHTVPVPATKAGPFDILWFRFEVLPHGYSMHAFCFGDGHPGSELCPCGNNGAGADHGCAGFPNVAGAYLDGTGFPSVLGDTVLLRASDLPSNSTCLFFQGSSLVNGGFGTPFNDGLLCAGGTQVRLGVKQVDPFGDAVFGYQQPGDPLVHAAGLVPSGGGAFVYQVWYRNNQGPCGNRSNMSNALVIDWGN